MRISFLPTFATFAIVLFPGMSAAGRHIILDGGEIPRVDPVVRFAHGMAPGDQAKSQAVFTTPSAGEVIAERDPVDSGVLWIKWPGKLEGKSPRLTFKEWRAASKHAMSTPAANAPFHGPDNGAGKPLWTYHAEIDPAPPGKSPLFARAGFIHPLCAPDGSELTGSRPSDHLHHMGVWHAWTAAVSNGKKLDFWNIGDGHGTVRFKDYLWRHQGTVWQGFAATQQSIAWPGKAEESTILDETLVVRSWLAHGMVVLDYGISQKNVSQVPLELPAYRYGGGVAFRGRPDWLAGTSEYLTSEGKGRKDAHTTRARWVAAFGKTPVGTAGMAILGAPDNPDAPQRLRTWQGDHGGAIFVNFVPTQETARVIAPGGTLAMNYRILTYTGNADKVLLDAAWNDFAHPVTVEVSP